MQQFFLKDLQDTIMLRRFPFNDVLYELLHPDLNRAVKVWVELVRSATLKFGYNRPIYMKRRVEIGDNYWGDGNVYRFESNLDLYLRGLIHERNIMLVPSIVTQVGYSDSFYLTAEKWSYQKPDLQVRLPGNFQVGFFTEYPLVVEFAPDGGLHDDSRVLFLGPDNQKYINQVEFEIVSYIRNIKNSVSIPIQTDFLRIDDMYNELKEIVEKDTASAADIYRGF